jgi:hypothetical protein
LRIKHRSGNETYTTPFSQRACCGKNDKYKKSSSWRGNPQKIIFSYFENYTQECPETYNGTIEGKKVKYKKCCSWRDNPQKTVLYFEK